MLQVWKLLNLEEVEVKVEVEPKGEVIVGSSREALRLPGTGTLFHPDGFPLCLSNLDSRTPSSL